MNSAWDTLSGGLPHSEIPGSTIARISPGLFAACHVLHRLSVPRHPPDALVSRLSTAPSRNHHHAGPPRHPCLGTPGTDDAPARTRSPRTSRPPRPGSPPGTATRHGYPHSKKTLRQTTRGLAPAPRPAASVTFSTRFFTVSINTARAAASLCRRRKFLSSRRVPHHPVRHPPRPPAAHPHRATRPRWWRCRWWRCRWWRCRWWR